MNNPVYNCAKANSFQKMKYMWPIDEMKKKKINSLHLRNASQKYTKFTTSGSKSNTKIYSLSGLKDMSEPGSRVKGIEMLFSRLNTSLAIINS